MTDAPAEAPTPVRHPSLAAAMTAILGENLYVQKKGYNQSQRYTFAKESDFLDTVRPLMASHGVLLTEEYVVLKDEFGSRPASRAGDTDRHFQYISVLGTFTFRHAETGETLTTSFPGTGMDSGDKAVYKALTGALKYCLRQTFLVATGDDPEATEPIAGDPPATTAPTPAAPAPNPAEPKTKKSFAEVFDEAIEFLGAPAFRKAVLSCDVALSVDATTPALLLAAANACGTEKKKEIVAALRAAANTM